MPIFPITPTDPVANPESSELRHETNHAGIALSKLLSQFQNKPRITAVSNAFSKQFQAIEDAAWDLLTKRLLSSSTIGAQLDLIGRIVGRPRGGLSDDPYRVMLAVQVLVNHSSGTPDQIIAIVQKMLDAAGFVGNFHYRDGAKAEFTIDVHGAATFDPSVFTVVIRAARLAGVRSDVVFSWFDDDHTFTGGTSSGPIVYDTARGGGDVLNPAIGGHGASVRQ